MSDYIASNGQNSIVSSPCTAQTNPNSLGEFLCGSECSQDVNVDDSRHVSEGAYTGINWSRLSGYIQPDQKMEKRGWFWDHGLDVCIQTPRLASAWGHVEAGNLETPGEAKAGSHEIKLVQAGLGKVAILLRLGQACLVIKKIR